MALTRTFSASTDLDGLAIENPCFTSSVNEGGDLTFWNRLGLIRLTHRVSGFRFIDRCTVAWARTQALSQHRKIATRPPLLLVVVVLLLLVFVSCFVLIVLAVALVRVSPKLDSGSGAWLSIPGDAPRFRHRGKFRSTAYDI